MIEQDPCSFRRVFHISISYGAVIFLLLCAEPVRQLVNDGLSPENLKNAGAAIGGLIPVGMALAALVAGMVRKMLFRYGGINQHSLRMVFLLGAFWHLPLTLCLASAARTHEPETAEKLLLYFPGISLVAAAALTLTLYLNAPQRRIKEK